MANSPFLQILAPNVIRVTHYEQNQGIPDERPWLNDVLLQIPENEKKGTPISYSLEDGLGYARNAQGECFFKEVDFPVLGIKKKRPYLYFDIPQTAFYVGTHNIENGIRLKIKKTFGESFYGWGEWFNAFERRSGQVSLDNRNALFDEQNHLTYSGLPFFISSQGYGFLLLNSFRSQWKISAEQMIIEADGPNADYILIYGPTYKEIFQSYTALTGRPPLLPRWCLGIWVTCYPQENQDSVLAYVRRHRKKKIPLDTVILDYHWEERFHNFKWRKKLFPHPQKFIKDLKAEGAHLGLILTSYLNTHNRPLQKWLLNTFGKNVSPGLEKDDERALNEFSEAQEKGYLAHENVRWWFGRGGIIDFTNPLAVKWWQGKIQLLLESGADFIKNDDGEDLPDDARSYNKMDGRENHNIYGFYYGRATFESIKKSQPTNSDSFEEKSQPRNIIYSRNAWIGSQRYPALFMGDQQANFEGIRRSIRAALNLSMCGFNYWTADGFGLSGKTTPEIHMRYAQWALLSPVARYFIRPELIDNTRFPWSHNSDVETNFRKYAELRMNLLPYYNSLAHESYIYGLPSMRHPMVEFQEDIRLRNVDNQIMLGKCLMICPVTERNAISRKVILPEGTWHDFWSDNSWQGSANINYSAPVDRLPILVRGGSILPMGPTTQFIAEAHTFDKLDFHIWPPFPAEGEFFDDDGHSTAYQTNSYTRTTIYAEKSENGLILRISPAKGQFKEQPTQVSGNIIIHRTSSLESVLINSQNVPFQNNPEFSCIPYVHNVKCETIIKIIFRK